MAYSLLFIILGLYLAYFWPRSIRRKIMGGEEPPKMEEAIRWMRPIGWMLLLYCFVELVLTFFPIIEWFPRPGSH